MNNAEIITFLTYAVVFVFGSISGFIIIGLCTMAKNMDDEYEREIAINRFNNCTDLISRSALLNELENFQIKIAGSANAMALVIVDECKKSFEKMVEEQSTVYDIDKAKEGCDK